MSETAQKILVYDGDCTLCAKLSKLAERRWLVGRAGRRPVSDFEGEEAARLYEAGIHNEMAVIDPASGEIRSGFDGIVWLLSGGWFRWLVPLLTFAPIRWVLRHDYRIVAYNRRIFAPTRPGAVCACDPEPHAGYRWAFLVLTWVFAALLAFVYGHVFFLGGPFSNDAAGGRAHLDPPWLATPVLLLGWFIVAAPVARRRPAGERLTAFAHLAFTLGLQTCVLLLTLVLLACAVFVVWLGLLPDRFLLHEATPLLLGALGWAAALPVTLISCLRRAAHLGLVKRAAAIVALLMWALPVAGALLMIREL